ncbi:MAG: hypothetical protein HY921_11450 [Elusimicrobia bacterium]|nr:hypothetical protein [Elusimicrobiota bacterium]
MGKWAGSALSGLVLALLAADGWSASKPPECFRQIITEVKALPPLVPGAYSVAGEIPYSISFENGLRLVSDPAAREVLVFFPNGKKLVLAEASLAAASDAIVLSQVVRREGETRFVTAQAIKERAPCVYGAKFDPAKDWMTSIEARRYWKNYPPSIVYLVLAGLYGNAAARHGAAAFEPVKEGLSGEYRSAGGVVMVPLILRRWASEQNPFPNP